MSRLPIIDMSPLFEAENLDEQALVAAEIRASCRSSGFFYVMGHQVAAEAIDQLKAVSEEFFALPAEEKMSLDMSQGGIAWRGFFPLGGELTSGMPDRKEGLYFGTELSENHPRVVSAVPLHGANLWPESLPEMRLIVLNYMQATATAAQVLMRGIALSLDLPADYFSRTYTAEPTILFRIFHYPPGGDDSWGVGEHTDYGLLTLLAQNECAGLQVKSQNRWIEAPPIKGALVCNIGDMLDRLTGGWYCSTPHRVRNTSGTGRLSFPLFFDPDFAARMRPLPSAASKNQGSTHTRRWDNADLHAFEGTYGDYLIGKVSKVFPALAQKID